MRIVRDGDVWRTDTNNAFIKYDRMTDKFWCQDHKDLVYGFHWIVDGDGGAPAYMTHIAKRVQRDLASEEVALAVARLSAAGGREDCTACLGTKYVCTFENERSSCTAEGDMDCIGEDRAVCSSCRANAARGGEAGGHAVVPQQPTIKNEEG